MDIRNWFIKWSSRKLEYCDVGKYQVKWIISNYAVKLDLPRDLHIHHVFHVNLFEPATTDDPYPGHVQSPDPPIKVDKEIEYKFTTIVDSYLLKKTKKLQYRIQ